MYKTYALGGLAVLVIIGIVADDLKTYDRPATAETVAQPETVAESTVAAPAPAPAQDYGFQDTVSDYGKPMVDTSPDLNPGSEESEGITRVTTPTPQRIVSSAAAPLKPLGPPADPQAVQNALDAAKREAMNRPITN